MIKFLISKHNGIDSVVYRFIEESNDDNAKKRAEIIVQSIILTNGAFAVDYVRALDVIQYNGDIKSTPLFIGENNHIIIHDVNISDNEYI